MKRSKTAGLVGGIVLVGALLVTRVAFSGKTSDTAGIAPAEFESMARLLTSQLEIDLPELLRTSGGAPKVSG